MYSLTNGRVTIAFEEEHGAITRFSHERLRIDLVQETRLAENFRLLLPLPTWRGHYIWGKDQTLAACDIAGTRAVLTWDGLRSTAGSFDIAVRLIVELDGDDATFRLEVDNHSGYVVEEAWTPALGGMYNPTERDDWRFQYHQMWMAHERDFYAAFPHVGLGEAHPLWLHTYDSLPWCDLYHTRARKGVYIGNHDLEPRVSMIAQQLFPNHAFEDRWPEPDEVPAGQAIGATLAWVSFPFVRAGEDWQGPPIVFHFHEGIWYAAADYYRAWFDRHFPFDKSGSWLYHEDAWQSTIISFPDDTHNYTFADLPTIARDAKRYGINVIQIDGWDIGGIDRDFPRYTPDPRLGTRDELVAAVYACQEMGVHVLLFGNVQVANVETAWFKTDLSRYTLKDYWGNEPAPFGWGYHTCLGFTGLAAPKQVNMDLTTPFRDVIAEQLRGMADLRPDGLQLDKTNALHGLAFDAEQDKDLAFRRAMLTIMTEAKAYGQVANPDFHLATEAWLDRMVPIVDAAYTRFFTRDHIPVLEYVFPEYRLTNCIMGLDDGLINNCVRYGHILNIEARNLHGTASDEPVLAAYAAEVLRIRRRLRGVLWYGRLMEPRGVAVDNPKVTFTLFTEARGGARALVLTHFERGAERVAITVEGAAGRRVRIHRPYHDVEDAAFPCTIEIPRNRLTVIEWAE